MSSLRCTGDSWPLWPEETVGRLLATRPEGSPFASANPQTGSPKGRPPLEGKSSTQWPSEMPPGEGSPVASATPTEVLPEDPRRATGRGFGGGKIPQDQAKKQNKKDQSYITKSAKKNTKILDDTSDAIYQPNPIT